MSALTEVHFVALDAPLSPVVAGLAGAGLALSPTFAKLDDKSGGALTRAAKAAAFEGKARQHVEVLAPERIEAKRVLLIGHGAEIEGKDAGWMKVGGQAAAAIGARPTDAASLIAETTHKDAPTPADLAALLAAGAKLRSYSFDTHKSAPGDTEDNGKASAPNPKRLYVHCRDPKAAEQAYEARSALVDGIVLARDLVNEPANILGPAEFASRARALTKVGVEIEVLDEAALAELGMGALLAVGQASARRPCVVVMQWNGAKSKRAKPLCFVGKGVVFDSGGLSMKPAAGMEDMKGDMAGAAAVTGLMHTLAARKAPVNAVGLIGLVENMVSGNAQRPGDIVKSMSGKTIEVLNTDAEGRLVLADVMWYAQTRFAPRFVIDLATLTGAIMVALGKEYAGLFSNDDRLAADLTSAGLVSGEKLWRMPLHKSYDKLLESKNADVKNIGNRFGGAITAAQFLQRFIKKDVPWAHLDIAAVAMDSNKDELSQGWASGWGVHLLDRFVADHHEKGERGR